MFVTIPRIFETACPETSWLQRRTQAKPRKSSSKKHQPKYQRIVLKLSGESLQGPQGFGIHGETVQAIAHELKEVHELGIEMAIMVGGGNIFRGGAAEGL